MPRKQLHGFLGDVLVARIELQPSLQVVGGRVGVAAVDNPKSPYRKFWAMVITD